MEVISIIGTTPGMVTATVTHGGAVRQVPVEVQPHPAGGWRARLPGGTWGARCRAVTTSVLLEAGEAFSEVLPDSCAATLDPAKPRPTIGATCDALYSQSLTSQAARPILGPQCPLFWKTKTLAEMTRAEWGIVCDGCGRCCLHKLRDDETGAVWWTNVSCRLLDTTACRCTRYAERRRLVPDCIPLTPQTLSEIDWLPPSCGADACRKGGAWPGGTRSYRAIRPRSMRLASRFAAAPSMSVKPVRSSTIWSNGPGSPRVREAICGASAERTTIREPNRPKKANWPQPHYCVKLKSRLCGERRPPPVGPKNLNLARFCLSCRCNPRKPHADADCA